MKIPDILLPYQKRWISNSSKLKIWEKSRRIGASWCEALNSVVIAARQDSPQNTYYLSTDKDNTRQFLADCTFWIQKLSLVAEKVDEKIIKHEGKDILIFVIRFASGKIIQSLPTKGEAIRSKQGRVVLDEAAFCPNLKQLIKAAKPLLMWGGQVSILSTHHGERNHFNVLCRQRENGDLPDSYYHQKTTFNDALGDGLFARICLVNGEVWTLEKESKWEAETRAELGVDAAEELDCIPQSQSSESLFKRENFEIVDWAWCRSKYRVLQQEVRFWDLAATSEYKNPKACFTAGVRMVRYFDRTTQFPVFVVSDFVAERFAPDRTDDLLVRTAIRDGRGVEQVFEREGGASGVRDKTHIQRLLRDFDAYAVCPKGSKLERAKPLVNACGRGEVKLLQGDWNSRYLDFVEQFPASGKDAVDASSGAFGVLDPQRRRTRIGTVRWG